MFERDKNHPSITMWSLGNEAHGYLNQDFCYNELKRRSDIPIHYEGVCRTKNAGLMMLCPRCIRGIRL